MGRKLHLMVTRDTFLLESNEKGQIIPVGLIGYEPAEMFSQALLRAEYTLKKLTVKSTFELVMPTQKELMAASRKEKEQWTRHIVSQGKIPPPGMRSDMEHVRKQYNGHLQEFIMAQETYKQYSIMKELTASLVSAQQEFIQSGDWIDKKKVTISMLANQINDYSERTVGRVIDALKLRYNGMTFQASGLLCGNSRSALCKALLPIVRSHPNIGAPTLAFILKETTGLRASVRNVSIALDILRKKCV